MNSLNRITKVILMSLENDEYINVKQPQKDALLQQWYFC